MSAGKSPAALLALSLAASIFGVSEVRAQANSSLVGLIEDPSGVPLPGVEVTVELVATSARRVARSSERGIYRVADLVPGHYAVTASSAGFKTSIAQIEVTVGQTVRLDLALELGEISEEVVVTDAVSAVDAEQGRLSELVNAERIQNLPLNGRNVYELMRLTPGAVDTRATVYEPGQGTNLNGGRKNFNGFWMDGITSKGLSGGTGVEDTHPNLEAVQEFRIETLNFSAEYGNSVGSIVNLVSKSGGNDFHGSIFEFHRNAALDARQFFDEEKPQFIQNQFGFSLGGPLVRDKTFFFGSYEGTRIRRGRTRVGAFESPAWAEFISRNGKPVARFLYAGYPGPSLDTTRNTVGDYLGSWGYIESGDQASVDDFLGSVFHTPPGELSADSPMTGEAAYFLSSPLDREGLSIRIDQELGPGDRLYGRYFLADSRSTEASSRTEDSPISTRSQQAGLNWTRVFSPTVVNEARVGYNRNVGKEAAALPGLPLVTDSQGLSFFFTGIKTDFRENIFTYNDILSFSKADHFLKLGMEVRRNQENSEFDVGFGEYYFFDLVSLGLDDPYYEFGGVDPRLDQGPNSAELASNFRGWRGTEIGAFFNDDWKILPNLTLNLGVRWDWYGRLQEVNNRATAFDMASGGNLFERVAQGRFVGPVDQLSADDWNNFSPRIGLAWDPFSDGKTALRAGFGVAHQSGIFNPLANSRWNKPFYSFGFAAPLFGIGNSILYGPQDDGAVRVDGPNPNPGASSRVGNIMAWDPTNPNRGILSSIPNPGMRDPYVMSFFAGVQREIRRGTTLEVNYVGTLGRKLLRAENFNRFAGDLLGRPNPVTGEGDGDEDFNGINPNEGVLRFWENSATSNYHALQVTLSRRFSGGLAFNVGYTLSKSLDIRSTWHDGSTTPNGLHEGYSIEVGNSALDYGRSIFDARHRLVFDYLWEAPRFNGRGWFMHHAMGGWQLNGILALQSGQPFTPWTSIRFPGGDFNADGSRNDRPDTPAIGNSISSSRSDFLNPNAGVFNISACSDSGCTYRDVLSFFGRPQPGTVGNLGRNTYEGPGYANLDFSLFKEIGVPQLGESGLLQLRLEFFNFFNRVNLLQPKTNMADPLFGRSTRTFDAREIQVGLRLLF